MLVLPSLIVLLYSILVFALQISYLMLTHIPYEIKYPIGLSFELFPITFPPTILELGFRIVTTEWAPDFFLFSLIFLIIDSVVSPILAAVLLNETNRKKLYSPILVLQNRFKEYLKFNLLILALSLMLYLFLFGIYYFPDFASSLFLAYVILYYFMVVFSMVVIFVPFLLIEENSFIQSIVLSYRLITKDIKKLIEVLVVNFGIFSATKTFLGVLGGGHLYLTLALGLVIGPISISIYFIYLADLYMQLSR